MAATLLAVACQAAPAPEPAAARASAHPPVPVAPSPRPAPPAPAAGAAAPRAPEGRFEFVERRTGGADERTRLPLVVALHGLGDRPESFIELFDGLAVAARIVAPRSDTPFSDGWAWFAPRGVTSDLSSPDIARVADELLAFAGRRAREVPTVGRPIFTGFSQGGALTLAVAARHPGDIAAALPVGGWLPAPLLPEGRIVRSPRVVAFHGASDARVPLALARTASQRLLAAGFGATLREYDGVGHGFSPALRADYLAALAAACDAERR